MRRQYAFPATAEQMLRSHRLHLKELLQTTDFFNPEHGHQRFAHFELLDTLLIYIFQLETGHLPEESGLKDFPQRPIEFGNHDVPSNPDSEDSIFSGNQHTRTFKRNR